MNTNKFGVPYHSYLIYLDNGDMKMFDMAWEENWGDVNSIAHIDREGNFHEDGFIGYGNDEDGYHEIVRVHDDDNNCFITPKEFADRCDLYVKNYCC